MSDFYDFDADTDFAEEEREEERKKEEQAEQAKHERKKKTVIHRTIVIAVCVLIVAIISCVVALAFNSFTADKPSDPSDTPTEPSLPAPTEPSTAEPSKPSEEPTDPSVTEPSASEASNPAVAEEAYFDDAVFIGDSVSYGLELYVTSERSAGRECLGKAQFLTSGSLSYANLLWEVSDESVHPLYKGKKMKIEDSLPLVNPKKIYILLGSNDVGLYGVDSSVEHAQQVLSNIKKACPEASIIVLSTTPKLKAAEERDSSLNNADINAFNAKMKEKCAQWGYHWLDLASQFKLEDGTLNPDYCGDPEGMGIHFLMSEYSKWVEFFENNKI